MQNYTYKIRLYPTQVQSNLIDKTIGCSRFIFNQMLAERKKVYEELKDDKEKLYAYTYKTEKEYKQEFSFLKEVSSRALQQARINLQTAYINFFRGLKQNSKVGFPKFKSKKDATWSYREPQVLNQIKICDNKIQLLKLGWIKFRYGSKGIEGKIKSVTVIKTRSNKYFASVLVEKNLQEKKSKENLIGLDLGLKTFCVTSKGYFFLGIKDKLLDIEKRIKFFQKKFSRQTLRSKRRELTRIRIAKLYEYKTNLQNHFFWNLSNLLCSENQTIIIEDLNISGMRKNRKLSHSIHYSGWSKFITMLKQKSFEYGTRIQEVDRFFPSSKLCSNCGQIKEDLNLSDRVYECECGLRIDRDLNAALNLKNTHESWVKGHRENVRPLKLMFDFKGSFVEVSTKEHRNTLLCN
jgi:putative transposase